MTDLSIRANRVAALKAAAKEKILILDGSWGVMIQRRGLTEEDFRGERFVGHNVHLRGNNDVLCLTRPDIIADLHQFKGAADATMSHGEGWRFLMLGAYLERAQLIARLLEVCFGDGRDGHVTDRGALMSLLRMGCALEPYLRRYTAEIEPRHILEFLVFDEEFPRSIRFATMRIEEHLVGVSRHVESGGLATPERLAGRLKARLLYGDVDELEASGSSALLATVIAECARIHDAIFDTFVAYSLEMKLPA